jgi:dinuclear metal center YbgI/SA1388 family protein
MECLENLSPKAYALDWDNVGLLVGRKDKRVKKIMIALDATDHVVDLAVDEGMDMLITHHPMIFSKIKRVTDDDVVGRKILKLAGADISYFAMHTNFDIKGGMSVYASNILELRDRSILEETEDGEGIGRIGTLQNVRTCRDVIARVKEKFQLEHVFVYGDSFRKVTKLAICPGSGKSVIQEAVAKGVDCLITGDIGHHEGLDAVEQGLTIIDATHAGIEKIFVEYIYNYLEPLCRNVQLVRVNEGIPMRVF